MVGTRCRSCGSAVSCKKKEAAAAAGAGGGGGEEPDLSGSEGLEANTELPQSRPGAGRALPPRGALPAGQMKSVSRFSEPCFGITQAFHPPEFS
ncbi:hypothetical protein VULLAG_LOCUS13228 [Vulpes lagopus]